MKYLPLILAFVTPAMADVQINQSAANGQFMHAPYDPNNTDNELYIGGVWPNANIQLGATQTALSVASVRIHKDDVPLELQFLQNPFQVYILTPEDTDGEQCTLTDVNGDARQTDDWKVSFRKVNSSPELFQNLYDRQDGIYTYRVTVWCSDK